jgi:two-component system, NtrC family, response regulator AtoC
MRKHPRASESFAAPSNTIGDEVLFGNSPQMKTVRETLANIAPTSVPVLIRGESGTGKDLIARYIHEHSPQRSGSFVKVNCPAIPGGLMESELFGYEEGAFTGAYRTKIGLVDRAVGGALFLDEIGEVDIAFQAKLLHLLQDGTFSRVGGTEPRQADFRIICTSSRQLDQEMEAGSFRQDLFYRINVVSIDMPPLRDRIADLPVLVEYFRGIYNQEYETRAPALSNNLLQLMLRHSWPGNIRELENLMRRYVILGTEDAIMNELLQLRRTPLQETIDSGGTLSLKALTRHAVRNLERQIIVDVLHANNWNRKETARILKISYRGLFYKLKAVGVAPKRLETKGSRGDVAQK